MLWLTRLTLPQVKSDIFSVLVHLTLYAESGLNSRFTFRSCSSWYLDFIPTHFPLSSNGRRCVGTVCQYLLTFMSIVVVAFRIIMSKKQTVCISFRSLRKMKKWKVPYTQIIIHSFIQAISIAPLQVHYYSEALPTTALILCRSLTPKRHRQLRVKDLSKVPTWRL